MEPVDQLERHESRCRRLERRDDRIAFGKCEPVSRRHRDLGGERADPHADAVSERDERARRCPARGSRRNPPARSGRARSPTDRPPGRPSPARVSRERGAAGVENDLRQTFGARSCGSVQQVRPGKARDEGIRRSREQLGGAAQLEDPAFDDHACAIGERRRILEVVGDEQRRQPHSASSSCSSLRTPPGCACRVPRAARRGGGPPGRARARARARRVAARRRRAAPGRAPARCEIRKRSSNSSTRSSAAERDVPRGRRGAGRARTPGRRARPSGAPAAGRCPLACRTRRSSRARCARARAEAAPRSSAARSTSPRPTGRRARASPARARALARGGRSGEGGRGRG